MRNFIKVMKALSDPNRVRMLKLLQERELCVCELNALFDLSQPTISKHLKVLEEAELVTYRKEGNWVIYRPNDGSPQDHAQAMLDYLRKTSLAEAGLHQMFRRLPMVDRAQIRNN